MRLRTIGLALALAVGAAGCAKAPDPKMEAVQKILQANQERFENISGITADYRRALKTAGSKAAVLAAYHRYQPDLVKNILALNHGYRALAEQGAGRVAFSEDYKQARQRAEAGDKAARGALLKALKPYRRDSSWAREVSGLDALKAALFDQRAAYNAFVPVAREGDAVSITKALSAEREAARKAEAAVRDAYFRHPYLEMLVHGFFPKVAKAQSENEKRKAAVLEALSQALERHADADGWCQALFPRRDLTAYLQGKLDVMRQVQAELESASDADGVVRALRGHAAGIAKTRNRQRELAGRYPMLVGHRLYTTSCKDLAALQKQVERLGREQHRSIQDAARRYKDDEGFAKGMAAFRQSLQGQGAARLPDQS